MRRQSALTLLEVVVVIVVMGLLAAVLLPALLRSRETARRKKCVNNLKQIGIAINVYSGPSGEYFPAHWDGMMTDNSNNVTGDVQGFANPSASLGLLYVGGYLDDLTVFACPNTSDRPTISSTTVGPRSKTVWLCFGTPDTSNAAANTVARWSGYYHPTNKVNAATPQKSSYMYDPSCHFRAIGPNTVLAADADGYIWRLKGARPTYRTGWRRNPRSANHDTLLHAVYSDAHVSLGEGNKGNYCSTMTQDNIFAWQTPLPLAAQPTGYKPAFASADSDVALWDETGYLDANGTAYGSFPERE